VTYTCWCDERGKLLDDGTVSRLSEDCFRVTAAEPSLWWLERNLRGFDAEIEDSTARIAVLSLQGPRSRDILKQATDADVDGLKFFRLARGRIDGFEATITRTGYSGDLGYEIWVASDRALALWDALIDAGAPFGMLPNGLDALDMARVEAGFLMNGVDYYGAHHCVIESRKSTPYESGLGWTVQLEREPFVGQAALAAEKEKGPSRRFVGLEVDWDETAALFENLGLPPEVRSAAWRGSVPVFDPSGAQVGYATSGSWSPILKQNVALATIASPHGTTGEELRIEMSVEHVRHRVRATVRKKPFFDPERKRA
jgi:aminomethyltransferase